MTNTNYIKHSLYANTKSDGILRGYYEPIDIPHDEDTDIEYTVGLKYSHKPGLLAFDLYGDERLNWVFLYYNRDTLKDGIWDLNEGITILIPEKNRLLSYLGG